MRDAWVLAALEREHLVEPALLEAIRKEAPEWVAAAVITKGAVSADLLATVAARAAHVPVADLTAVEPAAVQFVPESAARQYAALPLSASNRMIRIATANPLDLDAEQALGFVAGRQVEFLYASPIALFRRLDEVYRPERSIERLVEGLGSEATVSPIKEALASTSTAVEAPAARLVEATIADAVRERALEIRFDPGEQGLLIRYRIDGVLKEVMRVPHAAAGSVVRRLKLLATLDIADPRHAQDGRATARVDGKPWDLRISSAPVAVHGEQVVVRLTDPAAPVLKLDALGLWPDELALLEGLLVHRQGVILVSGPTDSGTTTTRAAVFERFRAAGIKAVTVEKPADAWHQQLAGALVLATLDAGDAASAVAKLQKLGLDARRVAGTLRGVVAQRLLRRLCARCAVPADVASLPAAMRPPAALERPVAVRTAKGCTQCGFSGYRGRAAIQELLSVDGPIAELIAAGATADDLVQSGRRYGMRTLWQSGIRRVWAGETSYDELVRVVGEPALPAEVGAVAAPEPVPVFVPPAAPAPVEPEVVEIATSAMLAAVPAAPPLMLVADDDPAMRVLIATILKAQGFEVAEAADGLEALDQAQRLNPAILLLDMDMPRLDGFGVLEALRRRLIGRSVPVIVVTARDDPATETRCIELGSEDYLTKPIQPSSLVVRIRAVLRRVGVSDAWQRS
jgi:type II secretory ATPase GspE/PulE/Tfp pilus assembly ATPase PilB-like protein/ActR/RegA family two-component response regulator